MTLSHADRVAAVARQVVSRPAGAKITIRKNTPAHSIRDQGYKRGLHPVDVSALDQILEIDTERRLVRTEAQVTMGELAAATLARGFAPAVVPEYRKFTVSGLINGEGIQSSSHGYGVFTNTLESVDLVTAAGDVVTASRTENTELFEALPESLGTLGLVVAATIKLAPAKRFVTLTYQRFDTLAEYAAAYRESVGVPDFHEGVIFGPRCHVLLTGEFSDHPDALETFEPQREGGRYYFQHVRDLALAAPVSRESITTPAYLFRSERGLWWMLECHLDFPLLSETAWGRKLIDKQVAGVYDRSGFAPVGMTTEERDRCLINQDMGVRLERLAEGVRWIEEHLGVYPIWNCAVRLPDAARATFKGSSHLVDLGIYGEPKVAGYRRVSAMRALQTMADIPSLWGVSYLSWAQLSNTFPERYARYERARQQVAADAAFLHLRDKVVWIAPDAPDPGPIPMWRLRRSYGARWYLNPVSYFVLGAAAVSKAIWRTPAGLG